MRRGKVLGPSPALATGKFVLCPSCPALARCSVWLLQSLGPASLQAVALWIAHWEDQETN